MKLHKNLTIIKHLKLQKFVLSQSHDANHIIS